MKRFTSDDLFLMSNLAPDDTGLPFVVWISVRGKARHDIWVRVSRTFKIVPSEMASVAIQPDVHVVEGVMSTSDLNLFRQWVELNRDVLIQHWDGEVGSKDAINAIRPIKGE